MPNKSVWLAAIYPAWNPCKSDQMDVPPRRSDKTHFPVHRNARPLLRRKTPTSLKTISTRWWHITVTQRYELNLLMQPSKKPRPHNFPFGLKECLMFSSCQRMPKCIFFPPRWGLIACGNVTGIFGPIRLFTGQQGENLVCNGTKGGAKKEKQDREETSHFVMMLQENLKKKTHTIKTKSLTSLLT